AGPPALPARPAATVPPARSPPPPPYAAGIPTHSPRGEAGPYRVDPSADARARGSWSDGAVFVVVEVSHRGSITGGPMRAPPPRLGDGAPVEVGCLRRGHI